MSLEVAVFHKSADDAMRIVRELRQQGLVQGKDFDFAFHKATYTKDSWTAVTPRQVVFTFYTERYATLFALKYS